MATWCFGSIVRSPWRCKGVHGMWVGRGILQVLYLKEAVHNQNGREGGLLAGGSLGAAFEVKGVVFRGGALAVEEGRAEQKRQ